MKNQFLSTALVLGALYGTANAATPITSPIYMPEDGKIATELKLGYTTSSYDKVPEGAGDEVEKSWNLDVDGKMGLSNKLALNFGFQFDIAPKYYDEDASEEFVNYYMGLTSKFYECNEHSMFVKLNVGQEKDLILTNDQQVYVDLGLKYGLELNKYNMAFSLGGKYYHDVENGNDKLEKDYAFYAKLENEMIFDQMTIGLDLFYNWNGDGKTLNAGVEGDKYDSYNEYGFNVDANYALNQDAYVGAYFTMSLNDLEYKEGTNTYKDVTEYQFGLKMTSQF